eukprot:TRINITY_DN10368_c0_g2_i3.p1 TRINITY_DN10368_c0_g2~~TRINITY_DN10368_c0_g2_i3.p1  ORF type:complete len:549 (+),score=111.08 TRINITY_DN10368_c0_g2_i3:59-1705(+)
MVEKGLGAKGAVWVVMQNCHFAKEYLQQLEKRLEEVYEEPKLPFRLWLTSMPTDNFPATLLQNSVKVTYDHPKGVSRSMVNIYSKLDSESFIVPGVKLPIWRKLLYKLVLFHATIKERCKFGTLGWNQPYDFLYSDFVDSLELLKNYGKSYPVISWDAVNYYIVETNYGGRMIDPFDLRRLKAIFSDMISEEALRDGYMVCANKAYNIPGEARAKEQYIKHARGFPQVDDPELFGLNSTAQVTYSLKTSEQTLDALSLLAFGAVPPPIESKEESESRLEKLIEEIPAEFDMGEYTKKFPYKPTQCQNIVLLQEIRKYNNLLSVIRKSLIEAKAVMEGESALTTEMESTVKSLQKNEVPILWKENSYPSLKPASSWVKDLQRRIDFFQQWIGQGNVTDYWISAFFSPQSLLTVILRNYSQEKAVSIDLLRLKYKVLKKEEAHSESNIYGLFIEGARWNEKSGYLDEMRGKERYSQMPMISVKPVEISSSEKDREVYECPVYSTENRHESYSIHGCTKTHITSIDLPISSKDMVKHWVKRGVAMVTQLND